MNDSREATASARQRDLLAHVSHDLRAPLASLQGYLDVLVHKAATLSEAQRLGYLETALAQCERLGRLVDRLFEFATLDRDDAALHVEPFAVAELAGDVLRKFALDAESRGVALELSNEATLPHALGDIGLIERVFENLLANALAHTPAGGRVGVAVSRDGTGLRIAVSDSGSGIGAADLPFVFERFYRGANEAQRPATGAGLGLTIVRRIVALHGGTVAAESVLGQGARFTFDLPSASP